MGKKDLRAFINAKKQNAVDEEKIDWGKHKDEWLQSLNKIYGQIESWLNDLEDSDVISFGYKNKEINEEHIGIYNANNMIIKIASEQILLEPIGTLLIGAKGRIDMKGKNGIIKFVLVPKQSGGPSIKVDIAVGDKPKPEEKKEEPEWVWKISTPPPAIKYIELDSDSFSDAVLEVIGG